VQNSGYTEAISSWLPLFRMSLWILSGNRARTGGFLPCLADIYLHCMEVFLIAARTYRLLIIAHGNA
jgi:hypothetical protein